MTLFNFEGYDLGKATAIKNGLVAPGCLQGRVVSQNLGITSTGYVVMCGRSGEACKVHGLRARDSVRQRGIVKVCPEEISESIFERLDKLP